MTTTVTQHVIVGPGGRIEFDSPQLREGDSAEVVITVKRAAETDDREQRLAAFRALQASFQLTPEAAQAWINEIRAERDAWRGPASDK